MTVSVGVPPLAGYRIRAARAADVRGIFHVRTSVTENHLSMAELACLGITQASVAAMIAESRCAWVAEDARAMIVGFSMIDIEEGALFAAFVLPSWEGLGIGRRLVALAEEGLSRRHAVGWLETGKETRAAGFYRRLGWEERCGAGMGDSRLEKHFGANRDVFSRESTSP